MNVTQVASVAAAFEASRSAGIQQAGSAASTVNVQRQVNRVAEEADVRETEAVQPSEEKSASTNLVGRKVDITV